MTSLVNAFQPKAPFHETCPKWVLDEARKLAPEWKGELDDVLRKSLELLPRAAFAALCRLILATSQPPVDPIEAAAREGCARYHGGATAGEYRDGIHKAGSDAQLDCAIAAIKVWIERGEGK